MNPPNPRNPTHRTSTSPSSTPEQRRSTTLGREHGETQRREERNVHKKTHKPRTWAEAASSGAPINKLGATVLEQFKTAHRETTSFRPAPQIEAIHLYFRARGGPISTLRKAVKELVPPTALLNIGFIGDNIVEILCNRRHKGRLVYAMNKLQLAHVPHASPSNPFRTKSADAELPKATKVKQFTKTAQRADFMRKTLRPGIAKSWFEGMYRHATRELQQLGAQAPEPVKITPSNTAPNRESGAQNRNAENNTQQPQENRTPGSNTPANNRETSSAPPGSPAQPRRNYRPPTLAPLRPPVPKVT